MTPVIAGALAGLLHVVSGPDHLVAVAPIAIHKPGIATRVGFSWGLGHATGVILLGLAGVLLRSTIDIQQLSSRSEQLVGCALIGIGIWALVKSRHTVIHRHPHSHEKTQSIVPLDGQAAPSMSTPVQAAGGAHEHLHVHVTGEAHTKAAHVHHRRSAFGIGILHGAAGTGHLFGVVPALALTPANGLLYLFSYGVAAIGAMAGFGMLLGTLGHRITPKVLAGVMRLCGVAAIALGTMWLVVGWH